MFRKMDISDIKLCFINFITIGFTTFANIEDFLKIILLVITIGYTITKWVNIKKDE